MTTDNAPVRRQPRVPQQGRSKASLERMLETAEILMAESGNVDFTINDVAKRGKVSIGSIYGRFESKDDLVHAVHERVMDRVDSRILVEIAKVSEQAGSLDALVSRLVSTLADSLREFAAVMRPFMLLASSDPVIAAVGKQSYAQTASAIQSAILAHGQDIRHPLPAHAADSAFRIVYASLARYLGFGSSIDAAGEGDWEQLKDDLSDMVFAYLTTAPRRPPT